MRSKDIVKVENLNRGNKFIIRWSLTYLCNYACDFCIQGNKSKHSLKSMDENIDKRTKICDNIVKFIETKLKNYEYIEIYLIGGEVTFLKDFLDIIEKLVNSRFKGKISIILTTNLSLDIDKLKKLTAIFNEKRENIRELHINASYYKEFAKEEEFIEKIKLISKYNKVSKIPGIKKLHFNLRKYFKSYSNSKIVSKVKNSASKVFVSIGFPLCTDSDYDEFLKFKRKYSKITPNIHFIIIKKYKKSISDKLKDKIVNKKDFERNIKVTFDNGEKFYCANTNNIALKLDEDSFNPKGYLCDIGIRNITISSTGMVSRCSSCKEKTMIGNMIDGFELPKEKLICPTASCNCNYYGVIEKNE
ncbi:MAG: radical SAM protein [Bacilli bacterium]|nr:radical SAM protein [Bacilli bacterium]